MLNNIRNFAKTKYAGVLVGILIVPFVLWGMGGLFSGGNKNNLAKINNENISTQDFQNYLNIKNIPLENIKKNIDNNIIEEMLGELISIKMLDMEINNLKLIISDKGLNKIIKTNRNFVDENNNFSRVKYEKFLLSANMTAPSFESRLKQEELKKKLFKYMSGGLDLPLFLVNNNYIEQNKKVNINYIKLNKIYKNKESFSKDEIINFIDDNKENLKEKSITFKYSKITPKSLIGLDEFNNEYYKEIDNLENDISNGYTFDSLIQKYNLKKNYKKNFDLNSKENNNSFYEKIFVKSEVNSLELLDENDFYILYQIEEINKILPSTNNDKFINKVKDLLYNKSKFQFNNDLITKINDNKFTQSQFDDFAKNNLNETTINSINDNNIFSKESIEYLYSKTINEFTLIADKENNIHLVKIINIKSENISESSDNYFLYKTEANNKIKESIYNSYDLFINKKYDIKINEKTLDRIKNYFR